MKICSEEMAAIVFGAGGPSGGGMSFLGNLTGTDSGVTNGVRDDGMQLGFGCGDAKTDHLVPDRVLGNDLTGACYNHDINYSTLGVSKDAADAKFFTDTYNSMGGGITGAIVAGIYYLGVSLGGREAYDNAQAQARERGSYLTGWGSRDSGTDYAAIPSNDGNNGDWAHRDAGGIDYSGELGVWWDLGEAIDEPGLPEVEYSGGGGSYDGPWDMYT